MTLPNSVYDTITCAWQQETLNALMGFIRLPALSRHYDSDWQKHGTLKEALNHAAQWAVSQLPSAASEILELPDVPPALLVTVPAFGGHTGSPALFYGHMDKQPEAGEWASGLSPWEPIIRDGQLFGRGAVDDGYNFYSVITAIRALEDNQIPHSEIVCLYETDEESGSFRLADYIEKVAASMPSPAFISILDLSASDWKRLWLTQSLRGSLSFTLTVNVLNTPAHSGLASGIVPDSFRIIRQLLERIENSRTGELLVPTLLRPLPEGIREQLEKNAAREDVRTQFDWAGDTVSQADTPLSALTANTWEPTLTVIGADGLPPAAEAGNLIRTGTSLRISVRIPPHIDAQEALTAITAMLTEAPPYHAEVHITNAEAHSGFVAPLLSGWLYDTIAQSSIQHMGNKPGYIFCGASIGTLPAFSKAFPGVAFVNTGALGPQCNAHAPNEWLELDYARKLTCVLADLIAGIPVGEKE